MSELTAIFDCLIPLCLPPARCRSTDPWFDKECRSSKQKTRQLERAYASVQSGWSPQRVADTAAAKAAWYAQRHTYRLLRQRKCQDFWQRKVEMDRSNPRRLWQSVNYILGCRRPPSSTQINADEFNNFFTDKVENIRASTSSSLPPSYSDLPDNVRLLEFAPVTADDIAAIIGRLPNKSSAADPMPTSLLWSVSDLISPFIAELVNRSLTSGQFPTEFKHAFITPIIKKAGLDRNEVGSYRPISNLAVLSKLVECVVARQLTEYLRVHQLLPSLQSGFRPGHSTETAILHVMSGNLDAVDRGDVAALVLLDLSAAFDMVDHEILLERPRRTFGLDLVTLWWSYLSGRT